MARFKRFTGPVKKEERERINEEIDCPEIRLILSDGSQHGIISVDEALKKAQEESLDLVEIAPGAKPPVCRLMDFGKFRFEKNKKDKEARKKQRQSQVEIKEIKFRPKIDEHDYEVKLKHIRKFLGEGNKVKVVIRFRGREMMFQSAGIELLNRVLDDVKDVGKTETKKPELQGRMQILMIDPVVSKAAQ